MSEIGLPHDDQRAWTIDTELTEISRGLGDPQVTSADLQNFGKRCVGLSLWAELIGGKEAGAYSSRLATMCAEKLDSIAAQ